MEDNANTAGAGTGASAANEPAQQNTGTQPQVDYGKIEAMINKGTQQKESAILKSYFEQQGLSGDEMAAAINAYKDSKQKAADEKANAFSNMQAENEKLKAELLSGRINSKATQLAAEIGIDAKNVSYVLKLADMSKAVDEKGELAEDAIKAALEQVVKDVPALKGTKEDNAGFRIGASGSGGSEDGAAQDELRKLFGVRTK